MKRDLIKIFNLKNVISIKDFNKEDINFILDEASKLENIAKSREKSDVLSGKILGMMFFEPSTRTRFMTCSRTMRQARSTASCSALARRRTSTIT